MKSLILIFYTFTFVALVSAQDVMFNPRLDSAPDPSNYRLEEIANDLHNPVYLTHAGDGSGRLFVVDKTGLIWIYAQEQRQETPFLDIQSLVYDNHLEQGLLGLAFHPNFTENGWFFVHYSNKPHGDTTIARYTVSPDNANIADPTTASIVFTYTQPGDNHNGGMIEFGDDGYLYLGLGDGVDPGDPENNAQNPNTLLGKLLRLDVDDVDKELPYAIPEDNPVNIVNPELAPEIWAWGLRNPWRFSFDRATGDLYIADVGQYRREEINFQPADSPGGENYGWRVFEGNNTFSGEDVQDNFVDPVIEYNRDEGCAVIGGYVYRGDSLPALQGAYLFGDWCSGTIWAAYQHDDSEWQVSTLIDTGGNVNINSFGEDEVGEIYVVDLNGRILKLVEQS